MQKVIDLIIAGLIYALYFYPRWRNNRRLLVLKSIMYVYIWTVLFVTILPLPLQIPSFHVGSIFKYGNFMPFNDYNLHRSGALRDILLNILMFIPFGVLYPLITKRRIIKTATKAFLFSAAIELVQLLAAMFLINYRSFDVTDIITNTIGAIFGYLAYMIIKTLLSKPGAER